jgi:hypothetical protein
MFPYQYNNVCFCQNPNKVVCSDYEKIYILQTVGRGDKKKCCIRAHIRFFCIKAIIKPKSYSYKTNISLQIFIATDILISPLIRGR